MLPPSVWEILKLRRLHMVLMVFLGSVNLYSLRININVAIVAMTKGTKSGYPPAFDWNSKEQGVILSSFYYGYLLSLFAAGVLATKVSGRVLYGSGVVCFALLSLITPWAAQTSFALLIIVRAAEGICAGIVYPCPTKIWSKWAPPLERSQLNSFTFGGFSVGTVVMMPVSGFLAENFGWQSVFYVTGSIACVWYVVWLFWIEESPLTDSKITEKERDYIVESLKHESILNDNKKPPIPWGKILTSGPVWAIVAANTVEDHGFYTLLNSLPLYLSDTLDLNLQSTGLIAALPYLASTIMIYPVAFIADWTRRNGYLSTTQVRKASQCGGLIGEATFMIAAVMLAHPVWSLVCIVCAAICSTGTVAGYTVNALDIAPTFSPVLMGFANSFGSVTGIVTPLLAGFIVQNRTQAEWNVVFLIAAGIYLLGCAIYFFFASGELQEWAKVDQSDDDEIES